MKKLYRIVLILFTGLLIQSCAVKQSVKLNHPGETHLPAYVKIIDVRPKLTPEPLEENRYIYSAKDLGVDLLTVLKSSLQATLPPSGKEVVVKINKIELSTMPVDSDGEDIDGRNYVSQAEALGFGVIPQLIQESLSSDLVSVRCIVEYKINGINHRELEYGMSVDSKVSKEAEAVLRKSFNLVSANI